MKKSLIFIVPIILFLAGCYPSTIGVYFIKPVVEISGDTTMVECVVPEGDQAGWQSWDSGETTFTNTVAVRETEGREMYITELTVKAYDRDGNYAGTAATLTLIPPIHVEGGGETTIEVEITIDEAIANDLEDADPNDREGYLKYTVEYYDENGTTDTSMPFYRPLKVNHPE